jgi:hypothetical protein
VSRIEAITSRVKAGNASILIQSNDKASEEIRRTGERYILEIASRFNTPIPEVDRLPAWRFMMICGMLIEEQMQQSGLSGVSGKQASLAMIQSTGKLMEAKLKK